MAQVNLWDGVDMGTFQESALLDVLEPVIRQQDRQEIVFAGGFAKMVISGVGLTYDSSGVLSGGVVTGVDVTSPQGHFSLAGAEADGAVVGLAFLTNDAQLSIQTLMAEDDLLTVRGVTRVGADTDFTAMGWGGNDWMSAPLGGRITFLGGDGNDTLTAGGAGVGNVLHGDAGDDSVSGAADFDNINGNIGADTCAGNAGDDWVSGGKDDDRLYGGAGDDLVFGNMGEDTLQGDEGADQVRGGQADDVVAGGEGSDYLSGDRGDDTVTGGAGADVFHSWADAGVDRVLDFHVSEGDRVMLDPGTSYTVRTVGGDTVIDMGGGNEVVLVGVPMSALVAGSVFLG